jgi:tRNA(Arg) A34 adenosine deaminase TadA
MTSDPHRPFLEEAIRLATESVALGGGPFGCVIVKDGTVIARGTNAVTRDADPTAHAEVVAIRAACRALGTHQLGGCDLYASCEPCPMCLGAIYWARPRAVFFAATRHEAAAAGFDDDFIYRELALPPEARRRPFVQVSLSTALAPFSAWSAAAHRREY